MRKLFWMLSVFSLVPLLALRADTLEVPIVLGDTEIIIPYPEGFHEVSKVSPQTRNLMEALTPASNRLVGIFCPLSDLKGLEQAGMASLNRYMVIQVYRELESRSLSISQFEYYKAAVKDKWENVNFDTTLQVAMNGQAEPESVEVEVKRLKPHGIFYDEFNVVSAVDLAHTESSMVHGQLRQEIIGATNHLYLKGKLIYVYVYSNYADEADLDWVKSTSVLWVNSIIERNQ